MILFLMNKEKKMFSSSLFPNNQT